MEELFFSTSFDADQEGFFGQHWWAWTPDMWRIPLLEVKRAYQEAKNDPSFVAELKHLYRNFVGRPSPLIYAENLTEQVRSTANIWFWAKIFLKNEGQLLSGAHKINHCIGQGLLAKRLWKKTLIAETWAGQHWLAVATVAAKLGLSAKIYMWKKDYDRQRPNVIKMNILGATVVPVGWKEESLSHAVTAALQGWIWNTQENYYLLGSALWPDPYPTMVADLQSIIGVEIDRQLKEEYQIDRPDIVVACVGWGSNSLWAFRKFLDDPRVQLIGVEAGWENTQITWMHAARMLTNPTSWIFQWYRSYFLQDSDWQIASTNSISAWLDYPGIWPQHAHLFDLNRVTYLPIKDTEALEAVQLLARTEGIFPALESAHAIAAGTQIAKTLPQDKNMVINVSGRGDKDIFILSKLLASKDWKQYLLTQADECNW